ncbi:hypothetical protein [Streptomyces sp. NPDC046887]|uniref:hypothetical protein n=1 Tax=Streptomyces sp. NPDC046887 TaxID=3155472 RepID=UPI0033C58CA4
MGRLWDRYMGTRHPDDGVPPSSHWEVRNLLFSLNAPDLRYRVRYPTAGEKGTVVVECQLPEVGTRIKVSMRLVPAKHEVLALHEWWEKERTSGSTSRQYGKGPAFKVYRQWKVERGPDGKRRRVETLRFDTREMTDALRNAVLGAGWTWRGVFKL